MDAPPRCSREEKSRPVTVFVSSGRGVFFWLSINVRVVNGHEVAWVCQRDEAAFLVEGVGVGGGEHPAAQPLKLVVGEDGANEEAGDAAPPMFGNNENICKISEGGTIRNDSGEGDLGASVKYPKGKGMLNGFKDDPAGNVFGPIRFFKEVVY